MINSYTRLWENTVKTVLHCKNKLQNNVHIVMANAVSNPLPNVVNVFPAKWILEWPFGLREGGYYFSLTQIKETELLGNQKAVQKYKAT